MLFGLTSSSRLFFPQRFGRLILWPSSGLSRTRELWNFEPNPLLFRGYHVLIPLRPLLLLNAVAAAAASIDAVTAIVLSLPLHSGLNSAPWGTSNFWFNALVASAMCLLDEDVSIFLGLLNLSSYSRFSLTIRGSQIVFSSILIVRENLE